MRSSVQNGPLLMPESFLHIEAKEQSEIYRALAPLLARSPVVLEKDVWVCWVLQTLFTMPGRLQMAFKGGTSLSKVFRVISRFSEDVDITLDYRGFDASFDPFADAVSKTRLKKFSEDLKSFVREHTHDVVAPHIQSRIDSEFGSYTDTVRLELSDNGEQLRLHYPSVLEGSRDYVGNSVLIEFGGRNITDPNDEHNVEPDISPHVEGLVFPSSKVSVLSPSRTFWEKATLIHVECHRNEFRANAARLSRHWYDLAMLADSEFGRAAIEDRALFADVVKHKTAFYNTSYSNYDACLIGQLRLIPEAAMLAALRDDFQHMIEAGMFIGEPPDFDLIVHKLRELEATINKRSLDS